MYYVLHCERSERSSILNTQCNRRNWPVAAAERWGGAGPGGACERGAREDGRRGRDTARARDFRPGARRYALGQRKATVHFARMRRLLHLWGGETA